MPSKLKKRKPVVNRGLDKRELIYLMSGEPFIRPDAKFTDRRIEALWKQHRETILEMYTNESKQPAERTFVRVFGRYAFGKRPFAYWKWEVKEPFLENETNADYLKRLNGFIENDHSYAFKAKETPTHK